MRTRWRTPTGTTRRTRPPTSETARGGRTATQRWLADLEGEPVRQSVVRAAITSPDEAKTYERLSRQRDRRVRWRGIVTVAVLVALVVAAALLAVTQAWVRYSVLGVLVAVLGAV